MRSKIASVGAWQGALHQHECSGLVLWGYTDRPMSEEDAASMARARAILVAAIAKK